MKIHQLNSVLGKERSKIVHEKKNYSRVHDRLQAEFSDEKYFELSSRNSNLVEGVKFQYYRMKQRNCPPMQSTRRSVSNTTSF